MSCCARAKFWHPWPSDYISRVQKKVLRDATGWGVRETSIRLIQLFPFLGESSDGDLSDICNFEGNCSVLRHRSVPTSLSILTCCGRCGLTNRSMAVADAELPPPMVPVVYGGPSFESILATSRDSRFSSFKKADVDMCQAYLLPSYRHQTIL